MSRRISPPPLKRQKRSQTPSSVRAIAGAQQQVFSPPVVPTPGALRIFSWNVNGIAPFVQPSLQKIITSFFGSTRQTKTSSDRARRRADGEARVDVTTDRKGKADDSDNDAGDRSDRNEDEDPSKEGEASLRTVLKRYGWPQVLFLQEVKIKPGDAKTQDAVQVAANDPRRSAQMSDGRRQPAPNAIIESSHTTVLADGGPEYGIFFNLPADPHNAKGFGGKVYGVAAIIRRDFMKSHVKEVRDVTWDREGRVQIIETGDMDFPLDNAEANDSKSSSGSKLAIFNVYAVNGTTNAYRSTYTGAPAGTRNDRKLAFHADLLREARTLEARGYQVVIAGDLNVAPDERDGHPNLRTFPAQHVHNRTDFNRKFLGRGLVNTAPNSASYKRLPSLSGKGDGADAEPPENGQDHHPLAADALETTSVKNDMIRGLDGIDTFRHIHGSERRYSYHPRGRAWGSSCDRVDLILASRGLEDKIANAGICDSPRGRGPSDHCPVWVEIGRPHAGSDSQ